MISITVGHRNVVVNETIFVPEDEEAEMFIQIAEGDELTLAFRFEDEPDIVESDGKTVKNKPHLKFLADGSRGIMTFYNWNTPFGASITKPLSLASTNNGEPIYFLGNIVKLGDIFKIECQLMIEELQNNGSSHE